MPKILVSRDPVPDITESLSRADAIAAARRMGKMLVTDLAPVSDMEDKILVDLANMEAAEILANYERHMANFYTLPTDLEGELTRLYRGEWSIWSGFPGTGKTTFIRQMCMRFLQLLQSGECVFIATLEQDPQWYIVEMAATAAGVEMPTVRHIEQFLDLYRDKLRVWGVIGIAEHRQLLSTVRYLAEKEGCRHAIIDSLMALDVDSTDNEAQRKFANLVSATARAYGVHIHLVAHPRKPMGPDQAPNIWDVAGSSDLGRLAFNVFFLRRGDMVPGDQGIGSMVLTVVKQRTRGRIGEQTSYFYSRQRQFHRDPYAQEPTRYLPDGNYPEPGLMQETPAPMLDPYRVERAPVSSAWET